MSDTASSEFGSRRCRPLTREPTGGRSQGSGLRKTRPPEPASATQGSAKGASRGRARATSTPESQRSSTGGKREIRGRWAIRERTAASQETDQPHPGRWLQAVQPSFLFRPRLHERQQFAVPSPCAASCHRALGSDLQIALVREPGIPRRPCCKSPSHVLQNSLSRRAEVRLNS